MEWELFSGRPVSVHAWLLFSFLAAATLFLAAFLQMPGPMMTQGPGGGAVGGPLPTATPAPTTPAPTTPAPTTPAPATATPIPPTATVTGTVTNTVTPAPRTVADLKAALEALLTQRAARSAVRTTIALPLVQNGPAQAPDSVTPTSLPTPTATPLPQPTPDGMERTVQVPILMYHYLSAPPEDADIYRLDLSVRPDMFAQHLDRIQAAGYETISLYDLIAYLAQGTPLPEKPVIITFDDGYRDNYENAFPLLAERGMKATFFVVTDFIDEQRPEYMTWDMLREMYAAGMSIESHGRNHMSLKNQSDSYLVWQALGSEETIASELGTRPRFVAYPSGQYDENTIRVFASAGYWAGLTTIQGATHRNDDLFQLRRVRVRGTTTADELMRLLGLDW